MSLDRMFKPKPRAVDVVRARELVAEGAVLLDVQPAKIYSDEPFEGGLNIPLDELRRRLDEVRRDRPVVVNCRTGLKSRVGARMLLSRDLLAEVYTVQDYSEADE